MTTRPFVAILLACLWPVPARASHRCDDEDRRDVCHERDIHFMPGGQAVFFAPRATGDPFFGAGVQVAPILWSHNNEEFGPSQGSLFLSASLLRSETSPHTLGLFEGGSTLSFERNSSRRWLIPYFGFGVGGILHEELPDAGYAHAFTGVHALWHPNVMVDLQGGYHFPFEHVDALRGPRLQLSGRFSLW